MKAAAKSFDLVLNTIPSEHDYTLYTNLAASSGGKHIILGLCVETYYEKNNRNIIRRVIEE